MMSLFRGLLPRIIMAIFVCGCYGENDEANAASDTVAADWLTQDPVPSASRRILTSSWDTLFMVGGRNDTIFLDPARLDIGDDMLVIFDWPDKRLLAFDLSGHLMWTFGREGGGPNEFEDVRDVAFGANDQIFVLDDGNGRITVLDSAGSVVREINITGYGRTTGLVPLRVGRLLLVTRQTGERQNADKPLVVLDSLGILLDRESMPWSGFGHLHQMATQGRVGGNGNGRWAYGFSFGPGWFGFDGSEPLDYLGRYVEPMPFPEVRQSGDGGPGTTIRLVGTKFAARDIELADSTVYVLYGGMSDAAFALIDKYDWTSGEYKGSLQLPKPASRIGIKGDRFYVIYKEPYPQLVVMRAKHEVD